MSRKYKWVLYFILFFITKVCLEAHRLFNNLYYDTRIDLHIMPDDLQFGDPVHTTISIIWTELYGFFLIWSGNLLVLACRHTSWQSWGWTLMGLLIPASWTWAFPAEPLFRDIAEIHEAHCPRLFSCLEGRC